MANEPDNEFNEMLDGDDELTALAVHMKEINDSIDKFANSLAPLMEAVQQLDHNKIQLRKEFDEKVAAINAEKVKIDEAMWEARKEQNRLKKEAESVTRQYNEARRAKLIKAQFATLEDRWDRLTAGAKWREWAKDHQIEAARKIAFTNRMILADTMGLGKTLSSIIALDLIKAATKDATPDAPYGGEEKQVYDYSLGESVTKIVGGVTRPCGLKTLYFCPATMMHNVEREIRNWAPHRSVVILGGLTKAQRAFALDVMTAHPEYVVIINYEAWRKDKSLIDSIINLEFDTAIIDEAHNIKDMKSSAFRGIKKILDNSEIPFVIPMTGTPILNKPQELFSLLTLVAPERFYNLNNFLYDYCQQDPYTGKWSFRPGGLDSLAKRIAHLYLRRTKEQAGIMLPPKTITVHEIEVDEENYPNQARAREEMRKWGSIMLDPENGKALQAAAAIAVYTRLRQIETWPAGIKVIDTKTKEVTLQVDIEESQKIDYVIKYDSYEDEYTGLLPEVVSDERVVIFSQFKEPLREMARRCEKAGIKAIILDGETPDSVRNEIATNFDAKYGEEAKWDVVLCNYRVGGVGLNFTNATQMIILDEEWNPGKRDQAYDRIHRIGQDKPVTIHVLRDKKPLPPTYDSANQPTLSGGGIDMWLAGIIEQKEGIVGGFDSAMNLASVGFDALKSGLI
jgi:SNF2 family DNA or RNA helicase